ncbi:LptF/LptG family permease [Planobacterium oryzisoli]|uniref:LptF/LptG family permease n=1 Tax=Planobacterium oryzisoli TaxID=2771435 RepID=A0A930YU47_9FLAO|nr:LptF/LptG family permease [Planobacterium oryzisoli]MBF5026397.1 LptF/LptG family permease [Planobacterium oryzisoli]
MKILDRYIIKTFFGPFFFIFSVLFFIFIVNIIWIQMAQFVGKGLTYWEITKLLFYMGVSVVAMVLPLTILLSSIMTFGEFGERYELAAMKAAGISLTRVMTPLFLVNIGLALVLFLFQNNITPDFQKKAKNMLYNIAATKPALNFTPGQFINQIPGYAVKFDKIEGENGERVEGVFIHRTTNIYEDQQAIVAKNGRFAPASDRNFLKLVLYDGYVYEDNFRNKDYNQRQKQPNQIVKFDTLVSHFDVSDLIDKAIEKEQITDDYRFQTYGEINQSIEKRKKDNGEIFNGLGLSLVSNTNNYIQIIQNVKPRKQIVPQYKIDTVQEEKRLDALYGAFNKIETQKTELAGKQDQIYGIIKYQNKMIMYQQRIFAYSFTCIIFFLIGASLGSIIRKGGMGLPVVIAIIIFIIFYVMNLTVENLSWKGKMNPYLAAWFPNMVLFPFGIWLSYKALTDSQLFDAEKYKAWFKPLLERFQKPREHARYR